MAAPTTIDMKYDTECSEAKREDRVTMLILEVKILVLKV